MPTSGTGSGSSSARKRSRRSRRASVADLVDKNLSFEVALARLEKLVGNLDQGNLCLEDALQVFEEGIHLSRHCAQKLSEAEQRIEVLVSEDDEFNRIPYEAGDEGT